MMYLRCCRLSRLAWFVLVLVLLPTEMQSATLPRRAGSLWTWARQQARYEQAVEDANAPFKSQGHLVRELIVMPISTEFPVAGYGSAILPFSSPTLKYLPPLCFSDKIFCLENFNTAINVLSLPLLGAISTDAPTRCRGSLRSAGWIRTQSGCLRLPAAAIIIVIRVLQKG